MSAMDFKNHMITYLEKKIKGCEELEMDAEKWAFIQCLLEVRKLCESQTTTSEPAKALDLLGVRQRFSSDKFIENVCLSWRHDFGLLAEQDKQLIRFDCKEWMRAIDNNYEYF